jgi:HEAT repeat protein
VHRAGRLGDPVIRRGIAAASALALLLVLVVALSPRASSPTALQASVAPRPGLLSEADTRRVVADRAALAEALAEEIGSDGAAGVRRAREAWPTASSRERLALVEGLRRNPSPEAVAQLVAWYEEGPLFRVREEILRALGANPAAGAHPLLIAEAERAADPRLSQLATAALHGEPEAGAALTSLAREHTSMNTRLEAVHSLAAIEGAEGELLALADDPGLTARVRVFAARELTRR